MRIDAAVNLILGALLVSSAVVGNTLAGALGVPAVEPAFYPSILGAVFIGIGVALLLESRRADPAQPAGLGLVGAVAINLCGGAALIGWLVVGGLSIPWQGRVLLWALALLLVGLSSLEWIAHMEAKGTENP